MTYDEAVKYIHSVNWCWCRPGLERISELCEKLGNPQDNLKFIHVAGTNGKGSFCAMLESVLRRAGYCTGLFTSPYIRNFNERMCCDGEQINNSELAQITEYVKPIADAMEDKPTEFELITAIGFEYFKRKKCDIVVLEVGMGGRLDSTNIIKTSVLSVITGIALDHTAILGDTIEKIAFEKAGIIKRGIPVLYSGDDISAGQVIKEKAVHECADYHTVSRSELTVHSMSLDGADFDYRRRKNVRIGLAGAYQPQNASAVLDAVDILEKAGMRIPENAVRGGLEFAVWHARFEVISQNPIVIFDGAHNPQGINAAVESIMRYFPDRKVYILSGVMKDKDYTGIAAKLAQVASRGFTVTPSNPRAFDAVSYAQVLRDAGIVAESYGTVAEALDVAMRAAKLDGVPLVCLGSLYMYCEIMDAFEGR